MPEDQAITWRAMGIGSGKVEFFRAARLAGVDYSRTLMLGRQELTVAGGFAEPLFHSLGAQTVDSLDASGYEGATVVHDLSEPIPPELRGCYTAVIDVGTLEHVYNFPIGIQNAMELVAPGGHLLLITPANNWMGHGFYQFSPELFFRVLGGRGFTVVDMLLRESLATPFLRAPWYRVADPAKIARRVSPRTRRPTELYVVARRLDERPRQSAVIQADYETQWAKADGQQKARGTVDRFPTSLRPLVLYVARPIIERNNRHRSLKRVSLSDLGNRHE